MQAWLYQMRCTQDWRPEDYRLEIWERNRTIWPAGNILPRGLGSVTSGDILVLFFAKSGNDYPGIYGWGVIYDYDQRRNKIAFQPTPPSDYLKSDPLWDDDLHRLLDHIRENAGRKTLWGVTWDEFSLIRHKLRERVGSGVA